MDSHDPHSPPFHVVYTVKHNGSTTDVRVEGQRGTGVMYVALGIAAQHSFLKFGPIMVLENGLPFRWVSVYPPASKVL
jgi:hypothetical protein